MIDKNNKIMSRYVKPPTTKVAGIQSAAESRAYPL